MKLNKEWHLAHRRPYARANSMFHNKKAALNG